MVNADQTERPLADFETIDLDVDGPVAWLRFDRPEHRNTVTAQMVEEMYMALESLALRDDIHVVVLTGKGRTFSPGADLNREPGEAPSLPSLTAYHSGRLLVEMPQVTIAAINGACAGAGLAWAAACDLRIASASARMALGFIDVGVSGELGAGWTLTRILGAARARELYLVPRKLTAHEALSFGLVGWVFPEEAFAEDVDAFVRELAGRQPEAIRDIKANLIDATRLTLPEYVDAEAQRHLERFQGSSADVTFARFAERSSQLRGGGGSAAG